MKILLRGYDFTFTAIRTNSQSLANGCHYCAEHVLAPSEQEQYSHLFAIKGKFKVRSYIKKTVSSPCDCSKRFTLHPGHVAMDNHDDGRDNTRQHQENDTIDNIERTTATLSGPFVDDRLPPQIEQDTEQI